MGAIFANIRQRYAEIEFARLWRWATKGGWAVLDQGLFSGANFLVNILLARWLAPEEYGAFAVALSIYYLLMGFHTAVLTEPMMVFGAGKYREHFRDYLGMLLYGHGVVSAVIALGLGGAALFFLHRGSPLGKALLGLAVTSPLLLLLWLMRRALYVELRSQWAAVGSGLYMALVLAGVYGMRAVNSLTVFSGLLLLGVASLVTAVTVAIRLRPQVINFAGNPVRYMVVGEHWRYGRWSMATVLLMWVPGNIYYTLFPAIQGLATSGALRALQNLVLPMLQSISALGLLVLPSLSSTAYTGGQTLLQRKVRRFLSFFVGVSALYWMILIMFHQPLVERLYGGKYASEAYLLAIFGFLPVSAGAVSVLGSALRAQERPDYVFKAYVFTFISGLVVGIPLAMRFGLLGAILGQIISSLTTASTMGWFFYNLSREEGV